MTSKQTLHTPAGDREPHKIVRDLDNLSYDLFSTQGKLIREHLYHQVIFCARGWATLLVGFRNWGLNGWKPPEYQIIRMRRTAGLWYKDSHYPMKKHHLLGLLDHAQAIINTTELAVDVRESDSSETPI